MPSLMEITLAQTYFSQRIINRWNYVADGEPAAVTYSFALTSAFGAIFDTSLTPPAYPPDTVIQAISAIQSIGVQFQSVECRAVYSNTDFYSTAFIPNLIGSQGAESLPPFIAYGARTSRTRSDIRRATKRFVGVPEAANASNNTINNSQLAGLATLCERMSEVLEYDDEGNTIVFRPAVVKKQRYEVPNTNPVRYAYRYIPEEDGGEAAQLADTTTGMLWEAYPTLRSQMSRQIGRGI